MPPATRSETSRPRGNRAGHASFVAGIVAMLFLFVPVIGDFITYPACVTAIVLGLVGQSRVADGVADNRAEAVTGFVLGGCAAVISFTFLMASLG